MNRPSDNLKTQASGSTAKKPGQTLTPAVSVVMPVHNALPFLDEAIESILGQTFSDFEFVILDDASTDGSTKRLADWAARDPRIRLLHAEQNLGPALSSQKVASEAAAPIVARMDADDVSLSKRVEEQLRVLESYPEVGLVASLHQIIDSKGRTVRGTEPWRLARRSLFVPFCHGAIMYRQNVFRQAGGYREQCEYWEDQDLIMRMAAVSKVAVIPRALFQVRQSTTSTRVSSNQDRLERAVDRMYRCLDRADAGGDYDELLSAQERSGLLDPRVFVALGSVTLWAGARPRLFRRLLQRSRLSLDFASLSAVVWTAWASLSPYTLRKFMGLLLSIRNARASQTNEEGLVHWAPTPKIDSNH